MFLVARLIVDTGPNVLAAARLESAPYDERAIRSALARVKAMLALAVSIAVFALATLSDAPAWTHLAVLVGGPDRLMLGLVTVLLTYAVATPAVREHRGIPIARPNLGPAAAAALFLATRILTPASSPLAAAAVSIVVGNLTFGPIHRFRAAARRIGSPREHLRDADLRARELVRPREESYLAGHALWIAPFLVAPVAPALAATFARQGTINAILIAAFVAAMPPILFDAKSGSVRFIVASVAAAGALIGIREIVFPGDHTLIQTALVVASYPFASRLLRCGEIRMAGLVTVVYLVAKHLSTRFPQGFTNWSTEALLVLLMVTASVVAARARRS